jgi:hypothetical protein
VVPIKEGVGYGAEGSVSKTREGGSGGRVGFEDAPRCHAPEADLRVKLRRGVAAFAPGRRRLAFFVAAALVIAAGLVGQALVGGHATASSGVEQPVPMPLLASKPPVAA